MAHEFGDEPMDRGGREVGAAGDLRQRQARVVFVEAGEDGHDPSRDRRSWGAGVSRHGRILPLSGKGMCASVRAGPTLPTHEQLSRVGPGLEPQSVISAEIAGIRADSQHSGAEETQPPHRSALPGSRSVSASS
ncbi:hypothetical protein FAIPA1_430028 [Frankia sp. AiPs1]